MRDRGAFLRLYVFSWSFLDFSPSGGVGAIIGGYDFLFSLLKVIKSY
jgi:hypothetical protein